MMVKGLTSTVNKLFTDFCLTHYSCLFRSLCSNVTTQSPNLTILTKTAYLITLKLSFSSFLLRCLTWNYDFFFFYYFCVYRYFTYMYVYLSTTCMQWPQRPVEGTGSHGTEVTDGCKPPCGYWDLNLGPPQKQQALRCWAISLVP